jgi:signal transduction histidine kinase
VRLRLIAGIGVVIAGLTALDALVLGTLGTQLTEVSHIGAVHARAVGTAAHLHEHLGALGRKLSEAVAGPQRPPVDVGGELRAVQADVEQLELLCITDEERAPLKAAREGLLRVSTLAPRVERARAAGDLLQEHATLRELSDRATDVSHAADDLVRIEADEVRNATAAVHASLLRAVVATSALTLVAMAGALLLLRQALRAIDAHEVLVERHAGELASFASRAAHELRTPLHTIGLALHVLRKNPGQAAALDRAEASARRLAQTIDDVLSFSRAGGTPEPGAACRVSAVVDAVATELGPRAAEAGLELVTDADGELEVAMAEGHLRTVVQNLVGNALKYGRSEGGRVIVRAAGEGGRTVLTVRDEGPGIPRDALPHVFEPFFRASTQAEGYGLGLPTVKRLVEAHGGSVSLASAPGAGTTVTVELPRSPRQRYSPTALPS